MIDPMLRRDAVQKMTGLSRATLYEGLKGGTFQKPNRNGKRDDGSPQNEVTKWLSSRPRAFSASPAKLE